MKRILIILLLVACQAHAEIYKSINADGEVVYSDTPTQGSERLKMPVLFLIGDKDTTGRSNRAPKEVQATL